MQAGGRAAIEVRAASSRSFVRAEASKTLRLLGGIWGGLAQGVWA